MSAITNIATVPVRILEAKLQYGLLGSKSVTGMVSVSRKRDNMHGMYDIDPGETRDLAFDFWIDPPIVKPNQPFTSSIELT
jgi:hypothetical protein